MKNRFSAFLLAAALTVLGILLVLWALESRQVRMHDPAGRTDPQTLQVLQTR